jgi:predicted enzyme related to lactoylglutathione lyase
MSIKFGHVNIIAQDWKRLASFYKKIFSCSVVPPIRELSGEWLSKGTAVKNASLEGVHLRLPGLAEDGPTLEIYSYAFMEEKLPSISNRKGFGHIAFQVDDVSKKVKEILANSGSMLGDIVVKDVHGVGELTFVYCVDPEDNIIEIQSWKKYANI